MIKGKLYTYGHWTSLVKVDEENSFGFVYLIINNVTTQGYIGKKQYYSYSKRKKSKKLPWRTYKGSSKYLHKDIIKYGIKNFSFFILIQCETRGALTYEEANLQHRLEVLTEKLPNGESAWYNRHIASIKYSVKGALSDETKQLISKYSRTMKKNTSGLVKDSKTKEGKERRSKNMKVLNEKGLAYRTQHRPVIVYYQDGTYEQVTHWPSFCEEEGYSKHGLYNMTKGKAKTMRRRGGPKGKTITSIEWIAEETGDE